jgi:SecD/SecF fusion protein
MPRPATPCRREPAALEAIKEQRGAVDAVTTPELTLGAIADSNITAQLAAGLLFFLASGPVRGFGVTLSIGVLASILSAQVVTRALAEWAVSRPAVRRGPQISGIGRLGRVRIWLMRRNPDFMRHGVEFVRVEWRPENHRPLSMDFR